MKYSVAFIYFTLAAVMLIVAWQCGAPQESRTQKSSSKWLNVDDTTAHYVGMTACRTCHEDKYQTFSHTGMGESFGLANPQKSAGRYLPHAPLYDSFKDLYYLPYWQDSALLLKEYRLQGKDTIYSRTERISYIIGSGQHTNSHIINVNGYLYQAPFTYYTQKGKLDLPPGFENGSNSRFGRALNEECITCHNAYPDFVKNSFNKYTSVPLGIDCERCHGPGSIHVQQKLAGSIVDIAHDTDFTIVNPRKLPQQLQIDVCQRCHLQGDAVLREGKTFFDHRPGKLLHETMDVFRPEYENEDQFIMASHAERMRKSQCYTQTLKKGGTFTCITCHNPHISVTVTPASFFISKCKTCHPGVHADKPERLNETAATNCITCHMPRNGTTDIPHVSVTDHYIHIVKEGEKHRVAKPGELGKFKQLACLTDARPDNLTRARAFLYLYEKYDHNPAHLDSAGHYLASYTEGSEPAAYIYYYYLRNDFQHIAALMLRVKPVLTTALSNYQAGRACENLGAPEQALPYFEKAKEIQPFNLDYRIQFGTTLMELRRLDEAGEEFDFVIKENPKLPQPWNDKGFIFLANGDIEKAETLFKKALALDPDDAYAHMNMAKVWAMRGDMKKARMEVKGVLKKDPHNNDAKQLMAHLKNDSKNGTEE